MLDRTQDRAARFARLAACCCLALGPLGCDADAFVPPLPDPGACTGAWQPLLPPQTDGYASELEVRDGVLYFSMFRRSIEAMPATGGERRVLVTRVFDRFWVEPDRIVLSDGAALYAAPRAGGEAAPVVDGGLTGLRFANVALDSRYFYWTVKGDHIDPAAPDSPRAFTIRRARSDGGAPPETVAVVPAYYDLWILKVLPDALLVDDVFVSPGESMSVVPKAGGTARPLPSLIRVPAGRPPILAGAPLAWSDDEVLWEVLLQPLSVSGTLRFQRVRVASGEAEERPFTVAPVLDRVGAWPAGSDGGWIVTGEEAFADGELHISVWSVTASGEKVRLACAPSSQGVARFYSDARAITADAVYAFALHGGPDHPQQPSAWSLVRIPRAR